MDDYPMDSILIGAEEFVYTTHVTHQQLFYVHVESRSSILDEIMSKLETRYSHLRPEEKPLLNKRIGSLCAAKFTDDGVWYRAKITGLLKNGHIEVQFVDYGNTDYVTEERIKAIDPDLIKYPVQSYRCCLADVSCTQGFWTPELIIQFEDRVIDRRCKAVFVGEKEKDETYLLQMFDSEGNNINQLFGAASRPDKTHLQNGTSHGSGFRESSFDVGTVFQAAVVYVKNPGLFWCQNTQFASDILILSEELSRVHMVQEMKPLVDVRPGAVCAAKFSEDEAWYRGIVHSVSGNQAKVYFVDYGNTEVVSLNVVCNLKPEMRSMPALAIKCRLNNVDNKGREWRPDIIEAFEELVVDKEFEVKVVGKEGDIYVVTLFDVVDNKDVGAQLQSIMRSVNLAATNQDINCNKQIPSAASSGIGPSLNVGSKVDVYLSWVDSPGDFWVQLSSAEQLLEQMSQQLQEVYSRQQPLAQPTPGAFVVAKFSQDGMWYRSLVLKVFEDGHVRVLFIDYGNSDVVPVTDLRQVTAAFGQVIPLASRCCLAGVKPLSKGDKSWGVDAKNILEKLTDNGCQCELLSETNSLKIVSLKVGSRDVARELLNLGVVAESTSESKTVTPLYWPELTVKKSETKEVVVTHIDSPKNFFCQITANIPLLRDLMKQISQQYASGDHTPLEEPIPNQACVAFISKEKSWYRAKITSISSSTYSVQFVDYGNSDVVPKCNVFVAEPTLMALPAQAFPCCISVSSDSSFLTEAFKKAVFKRELQMQVLEVSAGKAVVELFDGKTKVSDLLSGSKHASGEVDFVPAKRIPVGSTVKAFASFVVSPNKFFIQMTGVDVELADLMDNIALVYSSDDPPPAINSPHSGQPCVALYAEDDSWYRGQIVAVKGSACVVMFVDFGNEDTVSNKNIRVLTPELAQVPVLAYRCSVHGVPETEWSEDALEYFETLIMEQELTCTFVTPSSVRVMIGTQDVASLLLKTRCGATPEISSPLGRERESDSDVSKGSKLGQSSHEAKAGRGGGSSDDSAWDNNDETGADSNAFGRRGEDGVKSHLKYTDIRREELGSGDDRGSRAGGGRNGRDSRVEDGRKDFGSGYGRDRGDRRGDRGNVRGDREDMREDRGDVRGRDSRFENDRRGLHSGHHEDNGSRGGRSVESGGFRDTRDRRGREPRFEGAQRRDFGSNDGRESDSSSGSRHERNFRSAGARGREPDLGGDRGQGSFRFGGSQESTFGKGHNDKRTTTGQALADTNADFKYPEIPDEPESTVLVHMDEDGTFYLQLPSMEKDILFLSRRVAGSYKGGSGPRLRETPMVGTVCCAKFADDGNMYRAKVEEIRVGRAVLRYVDYGNIGESAFSDLKFLFPDLLQYPVQAFPCKLRGYNWSLEKAEKFAKATLDKELKVTFIGSTCPFEVDITTPEGDLLKILTGESAPPVEKLSPKPSGMLSRSTGFEKKSSSGGFGSRAPNSESDSRKVGSSSPRKGDTCEPPSITLPKQVYSPQPPPQDTLAAVISHVGSDGFFYLQLTKDLPTLDSISEKLQVLPEDIKHPDVSPGASCAAVFSEDSAWYRAKITETHGDSTLSHAGSIKPLSPELLAYPPLAYQSQFPELGALSTDAQAKLAEYLTEHQVTTEQGEDLQDVVCPLKKYRAPVVPSEVMPVGVTHIEDDGRFFVQLYQNYSAVTVLQDDLGNVVGLESLNLESAQVDMPCCLKVDTGIWHRGTVIDITDHSVHVFLVDSGKTVTTDVDSLRSLPVQFLKTPPFALECRLKGVEKWTGCLREKFSEMTQDKILNATFYNKTFPLRVSLARSIELDLLGLAAPPPDSPVRSPARKPSQPASAEAKTSYISHVDAHGGFYVQSVDREEQLNDLADNLETLLSNSEHLQEVAAGDVVCAQFTEDDAWYRAQVESCTDDGQFVIRFIDYGNSDVVGEDRLKALPHEVDILIVPPFAVKCRFFGVTNDLTPEQVDTFRETVADQRVEVVYRSLEDDVHEVEVSLDGLRLAQLLGLNTQTTVPAVQDLEKREAEPVVEKAEDSGIMESQDSCRYPGASSDVVDSTGGAFEVVFSVKGEPSDTSPLLVSGSSAAAEAASSGDSARISVSVDDRMEVIISHVDSPHNFYMQLVSNQSGLDGMMNTIFEHFSSLSESVGSLEGISVGDVCAALFEDESWYRVRVDNLPGDGTCEIFYLDYGNTETVDITSVRHLPERFQRMSSWALKARLGGVASADDHWTEEAVQEFKKMVDKRHLLADILQVSEDGSECTVHLLYMGIPVHEGLIKQGLAVAIDDGLISKNLQHFYSDGDSYGAGARTDESAGCLESTHLEEMIHLLKRNWCVSSSLQELKEVNAYVSHCSDISGHFWCQLSSSSDLSEISSSLASIYKAPSKDLLPTEPLCVGDVVVAVFDDDGEFYRAQILSLEGVRFVDYGNEGEVSQDLVFKLDEKLYAWPAQAFCCCLDKVQPVEDTWSSEAAQKLSELVLHQELLVKLVGREQDGIMLVDAVLQELGQSLKDLPAETQAKTSSKCLETSTAGEISEIESLEMSQPILESTTMVGSSLAKRVPTVTFEEAGDQQFGSMKLSQHTEYDVIVSNDELPSSFHVQLLELRSQYLALMSEIADHIVSDTSGETALFSPELGDACLVQHCGLWYRGLITARESSSWNVKSVDCGWTVSVSCDKLMALPAHLKELPAQAVPCYLAGIVSVELEWATDGVSFFIDSVREAKLCMYVLECADDGKYGVYLSDLDNTSSQSVNRALVDLGYAEVVLTVNCCRVESISSLLLDVSKQLSTELCARNYRCERQTDIVEVPSVVYAEDRDEIVNMVAPEDKSGVCRGVSDTRTSVGDVGCRREAVDSVICGCQLTEDEVCGICPDARVSDEGCGDQAVTAAVFGGEVIETVCPDARISVEPINAAVFGCKVVNELHSIYPDAKINNMACGDVALDAADYGCELTESEECSICPDGRISDVGCSNASLIVCAPDLETNEMYLGERLDAVTTPQEAITTSDRGCYPASFALCEHGLLPLFEFISNNQFFSTF
ncbi:unnamed protein product, partial [Candidula unifasciata]